MKKVMRCLIAMVAVALVMGCFTGCGQEETTPAPTKTSAIETTTTTETTAAETTTTTDTTAADTTVTTDTTVAEGTTTVDTTAAETTTTTDTTKATTTTKAQTTTKATTTTKAQTTTKATTTTKKTTTTTANKKADYYFDDTIDGRWTANAISVAAKEVYFQDGKLVVHCFIVNGFSTVATDVSITEMNVIDKDGKMIASAIFNAQGFTMNPLSYIEHTFSFGSDCILNTDVDMSVITTNAKYSARH